MRHSSTLYPGCRYGGNITKVGLMWLSGGFLKSFCVPTRWCVQAFYRLKVGGEHLVMSVVH
jgi:hypothetical protein